MLHFGGEVSRELEVALGWGKGEVDGIDGDWAVVGRGYGGFGGGVRHFERDLSR